MSTIPTSVTEEQFEQHIRPYLLTAQRGYECKIALYKVFNYILKRLHTGCQWSELETAPDRTNPEKKKSVGKRSIIIGKNGMQEAVLNKFGNIALCLFKMTSIAPM
ncbi:MAG: hypothetical protein WBC91_19835 [Phototrophicaceae bacterium]